MTPGKASTKKGGKRAAGEDGDRDDDEGVQTPKRVKKDGGGGKAVKEEEKGEFSRFGVRGWRFADVRRRSWAFVGFEQGGWG